MNSLRFGVLACASCTLVVLSTAPASYPAEVLAARPSSYFRFETDARDELNRVPMTYTGGAKSVDGTAVFDGVSGGVIGPDVYSFNGNAPFTIEVWIDPEPGGLPTQRICNHRHGPPHTGWLLYLDAEKNAVFERWNDEIVIGRVAAPIPIRVWSYVVVRYDGAELSLWIDGKRRDAVVDAKGIGAFEASLAWGMASTGTIDFFSGRLDEGAIYEHALEPARIAAHFAAR